MPTAMNSLTARAVKGISYGLLSLLRNCTFLLKNTRLITTPFLAKRLPIMKKTSPVFARTWLKLHWLGLIMIT
jgi:hypothetical protein